MKHGLHLRGRCGAPHRLQLGRSSLNPCRAASAHAPAQQPASLPPACSLCRRDVPGLQRRQTRGHTAAGRRKQVLVCSVDSDRGGGPLDLGVPERLVTSIGLAALWGVILYYAFVLAPGQTPLRDQYFIEKIVGLGENDGVKVNTVFTQLFNIMGIYPAVYAALLVPAGRSGNKVPAWPFIAASFATGVFALLPYFAVWDAPKKALELPPKKSELGKVESVLESTLLAGFLLISAVALWGVALTAGGSSWIEYGHLFDESKLVHVTTVDFWLLTAFAPFWMYNDAQLRGWKPRDKFVPALALLPVVGPALYLVLRPKAQ